MFKIQSIQGSVFKQRQVIKGFKTSESMYKFVNSRYDNDWKIYTGPLKPGTYAYVGQKWTNIKRLDASILAHV